MPDSSFMYPGYKFSQKNVWYNSMEFSKINLNVELEKLLHFLKQWKWVTGLFKLQWSNKLQRKNEIPTMDSEKSADNKRVTGHWQNFVDYLFFWTAINCSVITKNTWLCQVASREDSFHAHGQPATSFGSSQAVLSSFCFPENKKKCEKKPKPKPSPSPPNNNSTNRKVVIIFMPFLCKMKTCNGNLPFGAWHIPFTGSVTDIAQCNTRGCTLSVIDNYSDCLKDGLGLCTVYIKSPTKSLVHLVLYWSCM